MFTAFVIFPTAANKWYILSVFIFRILCSSYGFVAMEATSFASIECLFTLLVARTKTISKVSSIKVKNINR